MYYYSLTDVSKLTSTPSNRSEKSGEPAALDVGALDRSMLSSIAWTGGAKWTVQALSWVSTIVVVRLLSPSDYGLVGMAAVFLALLQPICDLGIGSAIVQGRHLSDTEIARLNGFAVFLGLACTTLTAAFALPISAFFHEPALATAVPVMGISFLAGAFRVVPTALLVREMGFKRLAFLETAEGAVLISTTLGLALSGAGYWSLVLGPVIARIVGSALAVHARPYALAAPWPLARIGGTVKFGAWVAASSLAWYAYSNADRAVVGRLLGEAALGAYAIGITLAAVPVEKIAQLYQRVAESVISRVQHDPAAVGRYLLRITEGVSMISFPLSIGLALVADQFVAVALGARWAPAVVPLRFLAAAAALRSVDPLLAQILVATGHASYNARTMLIATLIMPLSFLLGARWGLEGVALVWLVGHPAIVMTQQLAYALHVADTRFIEYLRALWPAVSSTAMMAAVVLGTRGLLDNHLARPAALAVNIAAGAIAYGATLLLVHPQRIRAARDFIRSGISRAPGPAPEPPNPEKTEPRMA